MLSLAEIRDRLGARPAALLETEERSRAAVALVVCAAEPGLEVLVIERSEHERDPWSGHLGFPGGRVEPSDPGPRGAAERETLEELGLDLASADFLGRLDDLSGAYLPVVVSCFVFGVWRRPELIPNPAEVKQAFWLPLADLADPRRRQEKTFHFRGETSTHPALQVLDDGRPWLWGITYRLVCQFLEALGRPL
jgi:8-oxo-dGTP pyrophosphatase MutT (NUDIX family)